VAWIAIIVTLGIAIVGWARANRADTRATRALELAEAAEARAHRLESAQFERGDVQWEVDWDEAGKTLTARSVGLDTAHNVEMIVDPLLDMPGRRQSVSAALVKPTGSIGLDLGTPIAAATSHAARARARHAGREINLSVRAKVTWCTAAGQAGVAQWDEISLMNIYETRE